MRRTRQGILSMVAALAMLSASCNAGQPPAAKTIVMDYRELGPQVLAHELIGYEWYQWNNHGSSNPAQFDDIKVIVYRDIPLSEVRAKYPVIRDKQDFRYLEYSAAMTYLAQYEHEPDLGHLRVAKQKIIAQLGP